MNTFRSTERSLTLLKIRRKTPALRVYRQFQSNSDSNKPRRAAANSSCAKSNLLALRNPKIKFFETSLNLPQVRELATTNRDVLISNPNKPTPDQEDELAVQPIVPLTAPRFPKSVTGSMPSVTKVLSATMSAQSVFILERWKRAMIKQLGAEGFAKYQHDTFERGKLLHALLANYLLGHGEPTDGTAELSTEVVRNLWQSIQNVVREKISNVRLVEHTVTHKQLNYRGIVDCVAFYENELVVIDFKTAEKPKNTIESLYDNPLQVSAYCGAINNDTSIPRHVIDRNILTGVVIVAYVDGSEASTYLLKRDKIANDYWKQWVTRLDQYSRLEENAAKTGKTLPKK